MPGDKFIFSEKPKMSIWLSFPELRLGGRIKLLCLERGSRSKRGKGQEKRGK